MNKKLKIIGVLSLILVFAFTLAACDNNTQSSLNDVEEKGDLIVTSQGLTLEEQDSMSTQSVLENTERYSNFDLIVKIKHQDTGRVKSEEILTDKSYSELKGDKSTSFDNIITGNWDIYVTVKAVYQESGNEVTIAKQESIRTVNVSAGTTTSFENDPINVVQEPGGLNLSAGDSISNLSNLTTLELRDTSGTVIKDSSDGTPWENIPAKQYELFAEFTTTDGVTYDTDGLSIMVLPGITQDITINFDEGSSSFDITYNFPPSAPSVESATADNNNEEITVSWNSVDEAGSYNIVRREPYSSRNDWEIIKTGETDTSYTDTGSSVTSNVVYEYAVVAVNGNLTSDYSEPTDPVGLGVAYVDNTTDFNNALDNTDISTIYVADGFNMTKSSALNIDRSVNIVAETKHNPTFTNEANDGTPVILVQANDVTIDGLNIVRKQDSELYAQGIKVDGSNVTIKNNKVDGSNTTAAAGIDVLPSTNKSINNITIAGNDVSGFNGTKGQVSSAGIKVCSYYSGSTIGEVTIEDNTTSGNTWGYLEFGGSGDINGPINLGTNSFDDGLKTLTNEYASVTNEVQLNNVLNDEIIKEIDLGSNITLASDRESRLEVDRSVTIDGTSSQYAIEFEPNTESGWPTIAVTSQDVTLTNLTVKRVAASERSNTDELADPLFAQGIKIYNENVTITDSVVKGTGNNMDIQSAAIMIADEDGNMVDDYTSTPLEVETDTGIVIDSATLDSLGGFAVSEDAMLYNYSNSTHYWYSSGEEITTGQ